MVNKLHALIDQLKGKIPFGVYRSNKWPSIRDRYLFYHPKCVSCLSTKKLTVHHIIPVHVDVSKELDENNLVTLCESKRFGINCHLALGHLGLWKSYNDQVIFDAQKWLEKIKRRP